MTFFDSLILGLVEGLTEFVPVSSTGHMELVKQALGLDGDVVDSFMVAIQSGAILAVLVIYRERFQRLFSFSHASATGLNGWRGLTLLAAATGPILVLAYFFKDLIKGQLLAPGPVAAALATGGLAMIAVERWLPGQAKTNLERLSLTTAVKIGLFQCLALWPGMSRAAATIIGGRTLGLTREEAAEFSFLAAVPVLLAATAYELLTNPALLAEAGSEFALGLATAFVTAFIAVKGFLFLLKRWTLAPFGWYRLVLAAWVFLTLK